MVPTVQSETRSLIDIIEHNLNSGIHLCNQEDGTSGIGHAMMHFVEWLSNNELAKRYNEFYIEESNFCWFV